MITPRLNENKLITISTCKNVHKKPIKLRRKHFTDKDKKRVKDNQVEKEKLNHSRET